MSYNENCRIESPLNKGFRFLLIKGDVMEHVDVEYYHPFLKTWRVATVSETSDVAKALRKEEGDPFYYAFLREMYRFPTFW